MNWDRAVRTFVWNLQFLNEIHTRPLHLAGCLYECANTTQDAICLDCRSTPIINKYRIARIRREYLPGFECSLLSD